MGIFLMFCVEYLEKLVSKTSLTNFLCRIEIPSYSNVYFNIWNVNATLILPNFPIISNIWLHGNNNSG